MADQIKFELFRDGKKQWETTAISEKPSVRDGDSSETQDMSKLQVEPAAACIYCGATAKRSREHVVAYALGGTLTIPQGSCAACQKITHRFETAVLRGPMKMVRYLQNMPSRSGHADASDTIAVDVTIGGKKTVMEVPSKEAPILLAFPLYGIPGQFDGDRSDLRIRGAALVSFGPDPKEFARKHSAELVEPKSNGNYMVAFACMVAKTAYAFAYAHDQLRLLKNPHDLVEAFMHRPDTIGRFVGNRSIVFEKFMGYSSRLQIHAENGCLLATVQYFSETGAPAYEVILGELKS